MNSELTHWLSQTGDTCYCIALALAPDERAAWQLLRQWAIGLRATPPVSWRDDDLIARLYQAAVVKFAGLPLQRRPAPAAAPILGPLRALPLSQRMAILANVLLKADSARLARILNCDPEEAVNALAQAGQTLAPKTGHALPVQMSDDACEPTRRALIDPIQHLRLFEATRHHLANCAHCRLFEREWHEAMRDLAAALRRWVSESPLPPRVAARLLKIATPRDRLAQLMSVAPLLALGAIVALLILPGLFRQSFTVVITNAAEPTLSAAELVAQALAHGGIPEPEGPPVWQARYQTLWYFSNRTLAPLFAEIWHDRDNPARHRLQLRHVEGGAPYEFQLGDGSRRFYYAIDGAYAPTLYGDLPVRALPDEPDLVVTSFTPEQQETAYQARRASGPWAIPHSYLQQAAAASNLRLLGRQRVGDRLAAIVSFRGFSPIDFPPEITEPLTVLMAIDERDGHVLSITELIGPSGATQTSRVVWKLVDFRWLVTGDQIRDAFTFERAWNGRAEASGAPIQTLFDPAWPLLRINTVVAPARLNEMADSVVLPATAPTGVYRAALLRFRGPRMNGVIYTGVGRRLIITFDRLPGIDNSIPVEVIGPWRTRIEPARGQRYRAAIETNAPRRGSGTRVSLDAVGFTLDEVRAIIASLQPANRLDLSSQAGLFASTEVTVR
ncbi:anti-sigma factor [Chloroflexus sp.]|uniref:anti-sigma factor n=1 Tax=Chloroflexus sp. TaxID=1904827 RepID=UPI0026285C7D|nr:anti-sigma factor [uncultured Chloroflexus sp.]